MSARPPIHAKTPAGIREVAERSRRLPPIQRRALILADGIRSRGELARLLGIENIDAVLAELVLAGLLSDGAPPVAPPSIKAPITAPPDPSLAPVILHNAKQLMQHSARQHLGLLGVPLQDKIAAAHSREALLSVCAQWHLELRDSRAGREVADAMLASFHDLLQVA